MKFFNVSPHTHMESLEDYGSSEDTESLKNTVKAKIVKAFGGEPEGAEFTDEFLTDRAELTKEEYKEACGEKKILVRGGQGNWKLAEEQDAS
ncbi:hypothetical protein COW95_00930 [Candidatus Peregrinibacteria bacterium CG22_combo_CG10-13_8_21_14_all_49_11]|nr:MAG: hypothetical protein COW95_00930 [Candidatus Peregrinibacteria bacterium CG22_combo_CG10-13_8_21_14_all_49_11]